MILRQICNMSTENVNVFLPSGDARQHIVLQFTRHIDGLAESCVTQRDAYVNHIERLQNTAGMNNASPRARSPPLSPPNPRRMINHIPPRTYLG